MSGKSSEHIKGLSPKLFSRSDSIKLIFWTSVGVVFCLAFLDAAGWIFDLSFLKSVRPQWEPMQRVTALCFSISALTLIIIQLQTRTVFKRTLVIISASLILLISLLSLYFYIYLFSTAHESPVSQRSILSWIISPEKRMAFLTACCFFLTASILFLFVSENKIASGLGHVIIIPVFLISYYTLISYILGVNLAIVPKMVPVALNTGIALLALGIAILHIRPETWLMKLYNVNSTGGILSRRLLLPALLLPILIGWMRIAGERQGVFASEQGVVLVAITYTFCFILLIWVTARYINKIDLKRQASEQIVLENRKQLSAVFNGVSETLMLLDLEGTILAANDTANNRFSKNRSELAGKNIYDLIPEKFKSERKEQTAEIILTKKPVKLQQKMENALLDLTLYPVIDTHGNVVQLVSFAIDITERKKAEDALLSQARMLEAVNDAVIGCDLNFRIKFWNKGAERIYGWKSNEVEGKPADEILRSEIDQPMKESIYKSLQDGHPAITELVQYSKGNEKRIIEGYTIPLRDTTGHISSYVAINRDITEHKRAEDALRESELKFFSIFHLSPVAMVLSSFEDGQYHDVNNVFIMETGYSREEIVGKTSSELNIFSDNEERERIVYKVKQSGQIYGIPCDFRLKNGEILPCLISINIISINGTRFLLSTIQDVSEITKTREALRQSEERFKAIAEVSPVGMGVVDAAEGIFLYVNPAYEQYFGYDKDELLVKKAPDIYWNPTDREKILATIRENNFVSNYEVKFRRKDGSSFWGMSSIRQINFTNKPALLGTFIDITKRKQVEDSLRISEQRLKSHIENSPLAVIEWGHDFVVTKWSGEAERIFGFLKTEVIGLRIDALNIIVEEDLPIVEKTMKRLTSGKELQVVSENRNYTKLREIRNCIWYNSVLLDEAGKMSSVMSLVEDVTEVRKVEKLLKESEEKLWSVLNATQESIYMFDRNGIITMFNSTGMERLKVTSEDKLIGHHFSEFMPPSIAERRQEKLEEVFNSGMPIEFEDERDGRMFNHNYFPVFKDGEVSSIVTYSTEITERKKAEDNLRESEDRFRTIAESLPVLISIYNIKDKVFSFVNESFEKTFGFNKGDLINRKLPEYFFNPEDVMDLGSLLKEKGRAYNKEIRVKKADGTPFWIMSSIRQIMFMNESSYLTASINITETKKAQEELLRLNRTLNARSKSSQAMMHCKNEFNYLQEVCKIIIEDCGHTMVWVGYAQNDAAKTVKPVAYYGFDKGYIDQLNITWDESERGRGPTGTAIRTGKPCLCKNMLNDPAFKPWRKAALERGYASSLTLPLILEAKPFGSISIYSKESDPFSENEIDLLSNLADDLAYGISYIRLEEAERSAAKLIRENETKLKELVATKDKFFNIVAHDLKNPFTSLIGSSELLFENIDQLNAKSVRDLSMILNDSAKSGYAILQNLLDWSRSQTGMLKMNSERVNLRSMINENIYNLQLPAANKEIKMINQVNQDIFVFADKNMINTILRNILSNALKFTYKSGKVVVNTAMTNDEVVVSVKDDGIGIPKDKISSLFHLEVKNSMPGTENEQGTGLGLKLSKEFAEKLGGRIWVESAENEGSEFSFSIPLNGKKV
jgi:PAS domain S-box-containing protein